MPPGDHFFFAALFFLLGVGGASLGLNVWILVFNAAVMEAFLVLWFSKKERKFLILGAYSLLIVAGALYSRASILQLENLPVPFGAKIAFTAVVDENPDASGGSLSAVLKAQVFGGARLLAKLPRYPAYRYGDVLRVTGEIERPEPASYANYLLKERVVGTIDYPEAALVDIHAGSPVMAWLYGIKNSVVASFGKALTAEEAAFASGLTFGERGGFSPAFKEAMQQSGTTHLVALSGYNVMLIVTSALTVLLLFLKRKAAVTLTVCLIFAFVVMTGAEASAVRAAIMGFLIVLALESGRLFDVRNAIMIAGLLMVLINPQVLVFDVGFALSFLALGGLVYLEPALRGLLRLKEKPGWFAWRKNLMTTASAQLAVLPVLAANFGGFSPLSLLSNVVILEFIPVTMTLSFAVAGLSFVSHWLSLAAGWIVWPLLHFEIGIVKFFGAIPFTVSPAANWALAAVYYAALASLVVWQRRKQSNALFLAED